MARTLKSSGTIIDSLKFLITGDDTPTTPVVTVYKSTDSGGSDNTSDVQSNISINASVSKAYVTFQGQSCPYFEITANQQGVVFPSTHRPNFSSGSSPVTVFIVWQMRLGVPSASNYMIGAAGTTGQWRFGGTGGSRPRLLTTGAAEVALSNATIAQDDLITNAFYIDNSAGTHNQTFHQLSGVSMSAGNVNTTDGALGNFGGDVSTLGYDVGANAWTPARWIMMGAFQDSYGTDSTGNANRLSAIASLHADPFGLLFQASSTGSAIARLMNQKKKF